MRTGCRAVFFSAIICGLAALPSAGDPAAARSAPDKDQTDILALFQSYCLDTELDIGAILSRAAEDDATGVSEADLGDWSQGIRPHDMAAFLLAEEPYLVLEVSLHGDIGLEHRRMFEAGLPVKSDPVKKDNPLADTLNLLPEGVIGTKGCLVFRVGDGPLVTYDQVSALTYKGMPLGGPEFERFTIPAIPAQSVRTYVPRGRPKGPNINFTSGHDPAGRALVRLTSDTMVFQSDDPETYEIPVVQP